MDTVDRELGAIARPAPVHFVTLLPKTRSGKLLRRSIQALAEGARSRRPHDDRGSRRRSSRFARRSRRCAVERLSSALPPERSTAVRQPGQVR